MSQNSQPAGPQVEKIAKLKQWAKDHYEKGGDVFVECYTTSDYERLLNESGGSVTKALAAMRRLASVFKDQQADAASHAQYA